jgi:surface antigen/LysM repeat protein
MYIRNSTTLVGSRPKSSKSSSNLTSAILRRSRRLNKRSRKRLVRFSIVSANLFLLAGVSFFVLQSQSGNTVNLQAAQAISGENVSAKPLDKIASTDVAVHVARLTGLQEATAVVNKADTASAEVAIASTDDQVTSKPQIVGAGLRSKKDIKDYTVANGDTVSSIAARFGVTPDTIRISNGLTGEAIPAGKVIVISPVNGIVYTVKAGDTPDAIATRYYVNKDSLIAFNDAELTGNFKPGERIVIPDGVQPSAPAVSRSSGGYGGGFAFGSSAVYGSNGYDYGWCTWHAANRRQQIGRPIPSNLGNAISWLSLARKAGLPTGNLPQSGAVLYQKNIGGLGHVAFVEKVNDDGSALVSDMNYPTWGRVTYRTITPGEFGNYAFIY